MPRAIVNMRLFTVAIAVAVIHFSTGVILLTGVPAALRTTPLAIISAIFDWNESAVAAALILSAILSAVPFLIQKPKRAAVILCIFPQQMILVTHLISALTAIYTGHFPDGYTPSGDSFFIMIDQMWLLTFVLWHTVEYLLALSEAHS